MSWGYRALVVAMAIGLVALGMGIQVAGERGDGWLVLVFAGGAVGWVAVLFNIIREGVADAVCRALTGQPMPPRGSR